MVVLAKLKLFYRNISINLHTCIKVYSRDYLYTFTDCLKFLYSYLEDILEKWFPLQGERGRSF